jgi:hypothetical protein
LFAIWLNASDKVRSCAFQLLHQLEQLNLNSQQIIMAKWNATYRNNNKNLSSGVMSKLKAQPNYSANTYGDIFYSNI